MLFIHPLTSEVFFGSSHGTWVLAPSAGQAAAAAAGGLTGSVTQQVQGFLQNAQ